jgi:hypothetical protein
MDPLTVHLHGANHRRDHYLHSPATRVKARIGMMREAVSEVAVSPFAMASEVVVGEIGSGEMMVETADVTMGAEMVETPAEILDEMGGREDVLVLVLMKEWGREWRPRDHDGGRIEKNFAVSGALYDLEPSIGLVISKCCSVY